MSKQNSKLLELIEHLKYDKCGLIPCVTQDFNTKEVLMLAFMNKEAILATLNTRIAHYFSRSRQQLWQKGEVSGNVQKVREMRLDCDLDSILLLVEQVGVACHTGNKSCFFNAIDINLDSKKKNKNIGTIVENTNFEKILSKRESIQKSIEMYGILDTLYHILQERKGANTDTSYTASLFAKGENAIAKKIIEEAGEFCFAFKDKDENEIIYEGADVLYHMFVALAKSDINPQRVYNELQRRVGVSGLAEKASRGKDSNIKDSRLKDSKIKDSNIKDSKAVKKNPKSSKINNFKRA